MDRNILKNSVFEGAFWKKYREKLILNIIFFVVSVWLKAIWRGTDIFIMLCLL
jgi:hypothetical protein